MLSPALQHARSVLASAEQALLDERRSLELDELAVLADLPDQALPSLCALAHSVRLVWCGESVEVEGIVSARTGGCPEDCSFCSQSAVASAVPLRAVPMLDLEDLVEAATESARAGASEFCIVVAVRGPDEGLLSKVLRAVPAIRDRTGMRVAASLGILTADQARRLAEGGVHRYNHNLETARSFFTRIVTTHTWEERRQTCQLVRETGMELCCGVILGMGETAAQRLELLMELREVDPAEVPLNFLDPRPGTPLAERPLMDPLEAIRWIAMFRLALPAVLLRYAGGREVTLRQLQALGLTAGVNGIIVGNYLTTLGRPARADLEMLEDLGMLAAHRPRADCERLDPLRLCPTCGARLVVQVFPSHVLSRCPVHGTVPGESVS